MPQPKFAQFLLVSAAALLTAPLARAAIIDKADNTLDLNDPASWVGGTLPTSADVVRWNQNVTAANTVGIQTLAEYSGLTVADPGGTVTLNGPGALRIGGSGIDLSAATQDLVIATFGLEIAGNQTWNIAPGRKITLFASIPGNPHIVQILGGTVETTGDAGGNATRFTVGGTAENPGLFILNKPGIGIIRPFFTGLAIQPFGTVKLAGSSGDQIQDSTNVNVDGGVLDLNGRQEFIGRLDGNSDALITNSGNTGAELRVRGGNYAGKFARGATHGLTLSKTSGETLTLSGSHDFSGTIGGVQGTLEITGSMPHADVSVSVNATLTGDGLIENLVASSGSTISPGGTDPATFEIVGDASLLGTRLVLQLNGSSPGSYDRLKVGSLNLLPDADLELTLGFTPGVEQFTIIDNLGVLPINSFGRFTVHGNPLSEGELFFIGTQTATISYVGGDGNDVVITVPEPSSLALLLGAAAILGVKRRRKN